MRRIFPPMRLTEAVIAAAAAAAALSKPSTAQYGTAWHSGSSSHANLDQRATIGLISTRHSSQNTKPLDTCFEDTSLEIRAARAPSGLRMLCNAHRGARRHCP